MDGLNAEVISYLGEMQRHYLNRELALDQQRISGLTAYVVGIAVLVNFYRQGSQGINETRAFQLLIVVATLLVLVFQTHWYFYLHNSQGWARKYANEIEQHLTRLDAFAPQAAIFQTPLTPETRVTPGAACFSAQDVLLPKSNRMDRHCWRTRKQKNINTNWCGVWPEAKPLRMIFTSREKYRGIAGTSKCPGRPTFIDIMASGKQANIWTLSILIFAGLALWYSGGRNRRPDV